jgi:malonate transporter and related proteins
MMQLLTVLTALFPVFLVIMTGFLLKERGILLESDQKGIEKLTYHVFFPAVVIVSLVRVKLSDLPVFGVGLALAGAVLCLTPVLFLIKRVFKIEGPDFTSLFQGTVRWNSFVAIALCGSLYGARGSAIAAIAILALIPLVNILGVMVLSHYGTGERLSFKNTLLTLIKNPFIWSSLIGLILSLLQLPIPKWLLTYGDMLGAAALATGLLMVGAGLELKSLKSLAPLTMLSIVLKLMVSPLIVVTLASYTGVTGGDFAAMMICASVPTASASYILARQMGGNAPLMAEIITLQTLVAGLTLPFWVWFS